MNIELTATLTAEQVARAFWLLGSDGQIQFFAELDRVAGYKLCMQMAGVVAEMARRETVDHAHALAGFQTMFNHAAAYAEHCIDMNCGSAKEQIAGMVREAKAGLRLS